MNNNSAKKNLIGRFILILLAVTIFCSEAFAQDYQMTLHPRRLGHQLGVEI